MVKADPSRRNGTLTMVKKRKFYTRKALECSNTADVGIKSSLKWSID